MTPSEAQLHESERRHRESLSTLAHELRNPLAALMAAAHLLAKPDQKPAVIAMAREALHRHVTQLAEIIDGVTQRNREGSPADATVSLQQPTVTEVIDADRIQSVLRESEERYRTIFEESNDIILTADLQQRITSCNPAMAAILELEPHEIIGHNISSFTVGDNFQKTSAMLAQKLREGGSTRYVVDVRSRSGRRMTWEVNSRLTFDATGKPTGLHAIARDVTETREAHNALLTSEARFRAAVNAVSGIVWTTNASGKMEGEQPAWTALTGQSPKEYLGDGWFSAVHPQDRQPTMHAWQQAVAGRRTLVLEHRVRREDGQWRLFSIRAIPVLDVDGAVREWVGVHTDITERKRAEDSLREADQRKDEFLAMLAHELRNPLAPIRTAAQVLKLSASAEPRVIRTSEIIVRQVEHMTEIVDDLLEVSRVTRGLIVLDRKVVNLKEVIAAAAEQCQPAMEGRSQTLTLNVPDESLEVNADAIRLVQIFSNLIGNAVKYTSEHGSILLVVVPLLDHVRISIRDTGDGIAPDLLPRIFDLFTQADRSFARSQGGLGLGLALVKRLVELHGGNVEARSEGLGSGSEFIVCLPRVLAPSAIVSPPVIAEASPLVSEPAPMHLLIVDDNKDAADLLGVLLEMEGHRVSVEYDAQAAIRRARREHPTVLLLDIGLPVMDGYELARQLRAHPSTASSRLIAVTGYGRDDDRRRSMAAGFDHHLVKPVNPDELNRLLLSLADSPRSLAE